MSDEAKKSRTTIKSKITRTINNIKRFVAEEDPGEVKANLSLLVSKFKEFDAVQDELNKALKTEEEIEASDTYYYNVQDEYITSLNFAKNWLKASNDNSDAAESKPSSVGVLSPSDVMSMINLPRIELEVFEGDPMKYRSFITMFDEVVDKVCNDDRMKMTRLIQYTSGKAKEAIRYCTLMEDGKGYQHARDILRNRFGNTHLVTERIMHSLRQGKPVKGPEELRQLSDDLSCAHMTLSQMGNLQEMESQTCIVDIVNRLQPYIQIAWKKKALQIKGQTDKYPEFKNFVEFVQKEAENANDPVYGKLGQKSKPVSNNDLRSKSSSTSSKSSAFSASVTKPNVKWQRPPCVACNSDHKLLYCSVFKQMKPCDRLQLVKGHKLCEMCLLNNHVTSECRKLAVCGIDGCSEKHSKFIHVAQSLNETNCNNIDIVNEQASSIEVDNSNVAMNTCANVHMPLVAVRVNCCFDTCALLDSASTNSFCTRSLVKTLGVQGHKVDYVLNTLGNSGEMKSQVVSLTLTSSDGVESLHLPHVYVVETIPVKPLSADIHSFPYLKDLPLVDSRSQAQILIGQDNSEALLPLEVRKGSKGQPFAVRTLLGWSLNGPARIQTSLKHSVVSHFITAASPDAHLNSLWNLEHESLAGEDYCMSQNDKRVVDLWDKECKIVDDHYEIPIPWKPDVNLPNNLIMARSRLRSLRTSLYRKGLTSLYDKEIQKLLANNYAELAPCNSDQNQVWYLPHHAVITDKKPGKIRVVFDCAAKFQGESLNNNCYQGPDFNNKLLEVLLRFRQYPIALMSDIEAMYNQVVVPVKDRDCLRFLWCDEQGTEIHYRMTRHLFGGVWCSSIATYALRRSVTDSIDPNTHVVDTVLRSFYVDDCLKSVTTMNEALIVVHETKALLAKSGFRLTKFVTNDATVLESIPVSERSKAVEGICSESESKALGIKWNVTRDTFCFDVDVDASVDLTRRKMLSTIASLFDPLGLVNPIVILGKQLFQEATRMQLSWDALVPAEIINRWNIWIKDVKLLVTVEVPRCIQPHNLENSFIELHHFSDASLKGYGCCSYIRSVSKVGRIYVALVLSKSRVAPLKQLTIPRLELQAALLAAKVDYMLRKQLDFDLAQSYFWVDSELVLKYICNEDRKFHIFVGNRISAILQLTQATQWHFIAGKENPADIVSRGQNITSWNVEEWVKGPKFLWTSKNAWKASKVDLAISVNDPEVKGTSNSEVCFSSSLEENCLIRLFKHYSSWYRLKKAVAWLLRLKRLLHVGKLALENQNLSFSEIKQSELAILKCAQWQSFASEVQSLSKGQVVSKHSPVRSLDPFIDDDGILRVGGRLRRGTFDENVKHPCLVSHEHPIASLIVREYHNVAHVGTEWVISLIRQNYWITRVRRIAKHIAHECFTCKKLFASPCIQKMACLPPERLEAGKPPFYYVGIDCFGPFLVKQGRSALKRYGCVFTCLNTRAIHLEKLNNMDTDSFLNAFRRFVCRRGLPVKVWSDNGTNFVGGKFELSKNFVDIDTCKLQSYGLRKGIEWHFNPPHASHMGGIWERMIRTIRKVLAGVCPTNHKLSDESLESLFCEVEAIINSRPITKVSDDVNDFSPLTPNHLLLLREQPVLSPGSFSEVDLYKRRWRCVQHLADQFWHRWLREYLPLLQTRAKWLKDSKNVQKGDLVLIKDENTPRGIWPMGIVQETYPSSDGLVRSVKIKTKTSQLVRPITKIVFLEGS